ncbi:hypothetical protein BT96DRAFT_1083443 [Gymnopus androsaceus JB14]|uniref:Uncharacterized protein n=1 Tax=Gymnopus androsaceus JB14 TaxID=1447944 RepID=A0A6A4GLR4_9AGAR|nr:hypothetical protein BT96DRAFT_1083443 [Gymnopus androsaceus JB14]
MLNAGFFGQFADCIQPLSTLKQSQPQFQAVLSQIIHFQNNLQTYGRHDLNSLHSSRLRSNIHPLFIDQWPSRDPEFKSDAYRPELRCFRTALNNIILSTPLSTKAQSTLGMDLDFILPGIPENGREIDGIDDKSELAHRIMLTNLLRILGAVKGKKASRQFLTRPTQVILPLSPNHGLFGNDGLYSESKISLEMLFQRWASESWGECLCLAGAVIGYIASGLVVPRLWGQQTLLLTSSKAMARKFSAKEMAFNILGLMHPLLFSITQVEPIWADLNGGMDQLPDLAKITTRIRSSLMKKSDLHRAIARDNAADYKILNGVDAERLIQTVNILPHANFCFNFPDLETQETLVNFTKLCGLIDLEKVIVVTGSGEVGPWGSLHTRWEMEARGEFTIEGAMYPAFRRLIKLSLLPSFHRLSTM